MYRNAGKEIKDRAEGMMIWYIMPWALLAIAVIALGIAFIDYIVLSVLAAACLVVIGVSRARERVLLLYAYGQLVERIDHLKEEYFASSGMRITCTDPEAPVLEYKDEP